MPYQWDELAATKKLLGPRGERGGEELARGITTQSYQAQGDYHIITLSETMRRRLSIRQCRIVT